MSEKDILTNDNSDPLTDDDDFAYPVSGVSNEDVTTRPATEAFFLTEDMLYSIEKHFRGFQKIDGKWIYKNQPIARDEFINQLMNTLRSVINPANMISKMNEQDLAFVMLEKNTEIIWSALEEPTLDEDDIEYVINVCDHTMQLFIGHLINGHGSTVARQMSANIYQDVAREEQKKKSIFDEIFNFNK